MEAKVFQLTCAHLPLHGPSLGKTPSSLSSPLLMSKSPFVEAVLRRNKNKDEQELQELPKGLPKEFYDDEWQARQREKTKQLHRRRQEEEEEEERKIEEYREIASRLKGYPDEEVRKARILVSSFIKAAEEVEEKIEEAAERGELTELVLMVIWNRLDLARRDTEILKREATPAMRLLNDLLNLHDGFNDEAWLKECKRRMIDTFPQEDPFSILVPAGFDIDKHQGPLSLPPEADDILLRVDFVREVDALLQEVRSEQSRVHNEEGLDPLAVANKLKQQEKQRTIHQVEALLDLAINLTK
ncbi:protein PALE CRESS, chloroplastic isoform X3 [Malania oleifera]|uniref:protein PALE CRESS, chloroplastic isoform X3 n=1 Tax=Malania oleifera TaxID=397392 RepID=UPI0025ADAD60|nr:protein PALE CRESS, chloroplastic isoform X3 [Malania oleifera]